MPIPLMLLPLSRVLPAGQRHARTFDLGGAVLLPLVAGALLAGLQVVAHSRNGTGRFVAAWLLAVGLLASVAFLVQERKACDPIVPLEPIPADGAGGSPAMAGLLLMPMFVSVAVASVVYGRLARRDGVGRRLLHGCLLMAAGQVLLALEVQHLVSAFLPAVVLLGAGLGIILPVIGTVAQLGVEPSDITRAVTVMQLTHTLGGAIGTTVTGTILAATLAAPTPDHPALDPSGASWRWAGPFDLLAAPVFSPCSWRRRCVKPS